MVLVRKDKSGKTGEDKINLATAIPKSICQCKDKKKAKMDDKWSDAQKEARRDRKALSNFFFIQLNQQD